MAVITISVFNRSTVLSDLEVGKVVPALNEQVQNDFKPVWGVDAEVVFVPSPEEPDARTWQVGVFDTSDEASALGYHDLTRSGRPLGKAFAKTDLLAGDSWTVTLSHEILEMLADPDLNLAACVPYNRSLRLYAYEVCDPCESDTLGYGIGGVLVSDFLYPAWFQPSRPASPARFDHRGHIAQPFQILPGCHASIFDVANGTGWETINPDGAQCTPQMRGRVGSRRERRRIPREQWIRSTATVRRVRKRA